MPGIRRVECAGCRLRCRRRGACGPSCRTVTFSESSARETAMGAGFWKKCRGALALLLVSALTTAARAEGPFPDAENAANFAASAADSPGSATVTPFAADSVDWLPDLRTPPIESTNPTPPNPTTADVPTACSPLASWMPDGGWTFHFAPDRWCNIDPQIRTSINSVSPDTEPKGGNYFAVDNLRLLFTGQVTQVIGFELNTEISGAGNAGFADSAKNNLDLPDSIHLLDADVRFEFNDFVKFWAGRFRPPSDRTNLSGPFFINTWDLPFVSKYPSTFLGRDDGVAYWGEYGGGLLKWQ